LQHLRRLNSSNCGESGTQIHGHHVMSCYIKATWNLASVQLGNSASTMVKRPKDNVLELPMTDRNLFV